MRGLLLLTFFFCTVFSQIPADGTIIPCDLLYLRNACNQDMACGAFELQTTVEQYVPIPECFVRSTNAPPADNTRVVTFTFTKLYGKYPTTLTAQNNFSEVHLFVDGLVNGLSLGMQIAYDWTGDGTFDRTEVVKDFATDNIPANYQDTNRQVFGVNGLAAVTGAWSDFVGGTIQLKMWQAFVVANGTMNVGTDKRSFIRIPHISTYALPGGAIPSCAMNSTTGPIQNKVAFVLETVEDFYLSAANQAVIDVFKQAGNISLTIAIISANFGLDGALKGKINTGLLDPGWELEVACNGYNYEDLSLLPFAKQVEGLTNCTTSLELQFGNRPFSFVAPMGSPSTHILRRAAQSTGYTHFSTLKSVDPAPYAVRNSLVYRFHTGAATYSGFDIGATAAATFAQIQTQLGADGYSVVSMTGNEFATGVNQDVVDANQIQELRNLLNMVKTAGYPTVTLSQMNSDAANKTKNGLAPTECNCVAFRLDDVQDYFLARAQRAVIDTFRSKLAPLTIGIIGSFFGIAQAGDPGDMTTYVQTTYNNATLTPCFDLEIAHHGYLHEDFSALDQNTQIARLNSAINVIQMKTGVRPKVFLPPFNLFNQFTVPALNITALTHLTSQVDLDPGPFDYVKRPYNIYHFPIGASTSAFQSEDYFMGVPAQTTFNQIKQQIQNYGWSVVMMHPQEYSDRYPNRTYIADSLLPAQVQQLATLIDMVRAAGIRIVVVGEIQNYFGRANETDPCAPVSTTGAATTRAPTTGVPTTAAATTTVPTTGAIVGTTASATTAAAAATTRVATTAGPATTAAAAATTRSPTTAGVVTVATSASQGTTAAVASTPPVVVPTSEEIISSGFALSAGVLVVLALLL